MVAPGVAAVRAKQAGQPHDEAAVNAMTEIGERFVVMAESTTLLVIPPAAARPFARTPEGMAIIAAFIGAAAAPLGLSAAYIVDAPAGPAIVLAAVVLFACSSLIVRFVKR